MPHPFFSAKLPPTKPKNQARRTREYLTPAEVERLISAARKGGRYGDRDATLMLLMYRHGLRVAEVSSLRWEHVDMHAALLHVRRLKHGVSSVHPLHGPELRALRRLKTLHPGMAYVFLSERVTPLTGRTIHHIVSRAGVKPPPCPFRSIRICCGTPAAFTSPTKTWIRVRSSIIWGIATFNIRYGTRNSRHRGFRTSGTIDGGLTS